MRPKKLEGQAAAIYIRVSTEHQQGSMEMQDSQCLEYAKSKGLNVMPEFMFKDEATSGMVLLAKREGGRKLLELLQAGQVQHLIILKLDRLGRNAIDIQSSWDLLTSNLGITIHVVQDPHLGTIDSESPMGKFFILVLSGFAQLERDTIRQRVQASIDHKIERGEQCGSVPYGWIAVPTGRVNTKKNKPIMTLAPHPEEQRWLMQMLEWRNLGWNYPRIAAELNRLNVPTKQRDSVKKRNGIERVVCCRWSRGLVFNVMASRRNTALFAEQTTTTVTEGEKVHAIG